MAIGHHRPEDQDQCADQGNRDFVLRDANGQERSATGRIARHEHRQPGLGDWRERGVDEQRRAEAAQQHARFGDEHLPRGKTLEQRPHAEKPPGEHAQVQRRHAESDPSNERRDEDLFGLHVGCFARRRLGPFRNEPPCGIAGDKRDHTRSSQSSSAATEARVHWRYAIRFHDCLYISQSNIIVIQ
jgi:hypothetical protein